MFAFVLALGCGDPPTADAVAAPAPTSPAPVDSATPAPVYDPATGFERTADGAVNRVADVPSSPDDYTYGTEACAGTTATGGCDPAACTEAPNGRCATERCLTIWCVCAYACASDADCAPDEACLRPEHGLDAGIPLPQCVPADCRTGADCPSGECGVSVVADSPTRQLRLACRAPDDACRVDADCESGETCMASGSGWDCGCQHCWCD